MENWMGIPGVKQRIVKLKLIVKTVDKNSLLTTLNLGLLNN